MSGILSLLQTASVTTQQPVNLTGLYIVSFSGLVSGIGGIVRAAFTAGRFQEFKESTEKKEAVHEKNDSTLVRQHEMQRMSDHFDRRFDGIEAQLAELRKLKMEAQK